MRRVPARLGAPLRSARGGIASSAFNHDADIAQPPVAPMAGAARLGYMSPRAATRQRKGTGLPTGLYASNSPSSAIWARLFQAPWRPAVLERHTNIG